METTQITMKSNWCLVRRASIHYRGMLVDVIHGSNITFILNASVQDTYFLASFISLYSLLNAIFT